MKVFALLLSDAGGYEGIWHQSNMVHSSQGYDSLIGLQTTDYYSIQYN